MENSTPLAVTVGAFTGVLIWMLAPEFVGHIEPVSAGGAYYPLALLATGIVAGSFLPKHLGVLYISAVGGQMLYAAVTNQTGTIMGFGLVVVLLYTLIFLAGGVFGARLHRVF